MTCEFIITRDSCWYAPRNNKNTCGYSKFQDNGRKRNWLRKDWGSREVTIEKVQIVQKVIEDPLSLLRKRVMS